MSCTPLNQFERPSPPSRTPTRTARNNAPTSARVKASVRGCPATRGPARTRSGAMSRAIWIELPSAIPRLRSILLARAMTTADRLSAGPPEHPPNPASRSTSAAGRAHPASARGWNDECPVVLRKELWVSPARSELDLVFSSHFLADLGGLFLEHRQYGELVRLEHCCLLTVGARGGPSNRTPSVESSVSVPRVAALDTGLAVLVVELCVLGEIAHPAKARAHPSSIGEELLVDV